MTPSDVRSEVILGPLETALQDVMTKLGLGDLNYVEIYLNVLLDHGGTPWAVEYYLVDHQARQIFWVDNVPATTIGIAGFPSFGFLSEGTDEVLRLILTFTAQSLFLHRSTGHTWTITQCILARNTYAHLRKNSYQCCRMAGSVRTFGAHNASR